MRTILMAQMAAISLTGGASAANDPTDICPAVVIDPAARNAAYYPGEPGRNRSDYSHIAVVLSATASCVENDDDQILATVSVTYGVEPGPLYRGGAEVTVTAALTKSGAPAGDTEVRKETSLAQGGPATVTSTITDMPIGLDDDVEAGLYTLTIGLVPSP